VTFEIGKADQTILFGSLSNRAYGDAAFTVSATGGASGNPITFTASGNCSVVGNSVSITGAGNCTITAHQAGNANYNAAPDASRSFSIAKANLTVTANNLSRVFGAANPVFTVSFSGFQNGENVGTSGVAGSPNCTTTATAPSMIGTYDITCTLGSLTAANYGFTFVKGTLTITAKYTTNGFFQPVDMNTLNTVKAGSTVPLKFEVLVAGTKICDTSLVKSLTVREGTAPSYLPTDAIEEVATGGTSLRCDSTSGQYIYNWSTKGLTATKKYTVTITLVDGTQIYAYFLMK
jgi:hypothetical protein